MYKPGKMKIKVFTVSKKYFFSISNVFKVYCCSAQKYGANERLRVYYKFTDGSTETVQIASPENLFWPATEISDLKQLKPKPEAYQSADGNILKYVALFKKKSNVFQGPLTQLSVFPNGSKLFGSIMTIKSRFLRKFYSNPMMHQE